MKKAFIIFLILALLCFTSFALDGGYFFDVQTSQLGHIIIYIPSNYSHGYFTLDNDVPFNVSSTTINGFGSWSDSYSIRWTSFNSAEYRPTTGMGITWNPLTISEVYETNVSYIVNGENDFYLDDSLFRLLILAFVVCVFVVLIARR